MNNFISKPEINFWVPILVAVVSAAMSFGILSNRVANNERDILQSEVKIDLAIDNATNQFNKTAETLLEIQVQLARIQTDLGYIKDQL